MSTRSVHGVFPGRAARLAIAICCACCRLTLFPIVHGSRAITQTNANDLIPRCAGVGPIRLLQHTGQLSTLSNEIPPRDAALHLFAGNRTASAISYSSAEVREEPSFT